jgi:hypothetical protein
MKETNNKASFVLCVNGLNSDFPCSYAIEGLLSIYLSVCLSVSLSIYLSIYLSIHLPICLSVYLSMALQPFVEPSPFISFLILYTVGRTPWTEDQPVARLYTEQHKKNKLTDIHASSGIWTHGPSVRAKTVHALHCAVTVIGTCGT